MRSSHIVLPVLFGALLSIVACGDDKGFTPIDDRESSTSSSSSSSGSSSGSNNNTSSGGSSSGEQPSAPPPGGKCVPSTGSWPSLIPGPGQDGYDAGLAVTVSKYDRFHEALGSMATGLSGGLAVTDVPADRLKLEYLLETPWDADDADPSDDLMQYAGLDAKTFVTSWSFATGMYAGSEMAADAFRYGVLRDRAGSCNDVARARAMIKRALDSFHIAIDITGTPGSIARSIARKDLPGDGKVPTTPIFDSQGKPQPAEKNNGEWREDNSKTKSYPNWIWSDSCSRDMLFGWTFGIASIWEVIKDDQSFDQATKDRLKADAKSILDGLMIKRSNGKDLELWDPEGRRTFHGNMHETSVDREYVLKNGVSSMMALGEVAGLVSVVDDAPAKAFLESLIKTRKLIDATKETMQVVAFGGEDSNHSGFNMLFMTAWMANRYIADGNARAELRNPVEKSLYAPLFGDSKPKEWKQSFFDLIVAASSGNAWVGGPSTASFDKGAVARGVETLTQFPQAPFYSVPKSNCDEAELAAGVCVLNSGTTVKVTKVKDKWVADKPVPMAHRPPSNFYWRSDPFVVNSNHDGSNSINPGSDIRVAYWMGRYVRTQ